MPNNTDTPVAAFFTLNRFLRLAAPTDEDITDKAGWPAGFVHIPKGTTAEWTKQLTAEQLMTIKTRQGFQKLEWQQTRDRNEALDCRVYARACAWLMGMDRWDGAKWDDLRAQLIPPCFVYKTTRLPDVLAKLRREQKHLAVVTDEYGGTLGVITMEDVLEELVGDIWDEKDVVENEVVTRPDGGYELDGAMTLSDFLELLDWNEDALDDADSTTVGGWTLERFGTFPKVGDSFRYENLTVTVLAMDGRRVERVLVQPDPDADKDKDA